MYSAPTACNMAEKLTNIVDYHWEREALDMHPQAAAAVYAALNINNWGYYAAKRYASRRGALALFRLCLIIEVQDDEGGR